MSQSRLAMVTGGAGGIGSDICRRLAAAGHHVVVADLSLEACESLAQELGGTGLVLDVSDPEAVTAAIAKTSGNRGPVEICVNCVGWDEAKPFLETDEAFSAKVLDINLAGPIRVIRDVLPGMIDAGWGRIVNIASDAGRVGSSLESVYSAAKGGMIAFSKTMAREFARYAITVNTVCPGPTDTALLSGMIDDSETFGRVISAITKSVPLRRLGKPDDFGPAVAFLCSEEAGFITGQTLSVSGGLTMAG